MRVKSLRFALIMLAVWLLPGTRLSFGAAAADIMIIYNSNMPQSKDVALHYAEQRGVPETNIHGFDLPTGESMSRQRYDKNLAAPLAPLVRDFTATHPGPPILLLVYGIPLKVGAKTQTAPDALESIAREKIKALSAQVALNLQKLSNIVSPSVFDAEAIAALTPEELLPKAAEIIRFAAGYLQEHGGKENDILAMQANAIILRLTGLSPVADSLAKQTELRKPEIIQAMTAAPLFQMNAVLEAGLAQLLFHGATIDTAPDLAATILMSKGITGELQFWLGVSKISDDEESSASVESELSLLSAGSYRLGKWLPNPFLEQYDSYPAIQLLRRSTLRVARLDGPTPETAKRLVDDALVVEAKGLAGILYIDARGLKERNNDYYSLYDQRLKSLYKLVKEQSSFPVVLDDSNELFPVNGCPDAALYCGWYSLKNYRDSFSWKQGAVGFHVASGEATTLRRQDSQVWCKRMLEEGVAATLGPVQEPYLQSFPRPDLFFPLLMSGRLPLIEVYYRTLPYLSWRQILIGDPLYKPFEKNPVMPWD